MRDTGAGGAWRNYAYDNRGNVADDGRLTFTYDAAEQPTSMGGTAAGAFVYDGNLKRVKQTIAGETIYSVYALSGAILYRDNATTGEATDYIRAAGQTIARLRGGVTTFPHQDHLGSPIAETGLAGAVNWREAYAAYGEKRLDPVGNRDNEGFTGHIDDAESGLTYMQARYYDPVIGRFLSNDPVGFSIDKPQQFNRYSYTWNDPINAVDPTGELLILAACLNPACASVIAAGTAGAAALAAKAVIDNTNTLKNESSKPASHEPRSLTDGEKTKVKEAGAAPSGKAGLTEEGRAAQKHGDRSGSAFPDAGNTTGERNASGAESTTGIVDAEGSTIAVNDKGETIVRAPDGRGIKLNPDGSFNGFREPPKPPEERQ